MIVPLFPSAQHPDSDPSGSAAEEENVPPLQNQPLSSSLPPGTLATSMSGTRGTSVAGERKPLATGDNSETSQGRLMLCAIIGSQWGRWSDLAEGSSPASYKRKGSVPRVMQIIDSMPRLKAMKDSRYPFPRCFGFALIRAWSKAPPPFIVGAELSDALRKTLPDAPRHHGESDRLIIAHCVEDAVELMQPMTWVGGLHGLWEACKDLIFIIPTGSINTFCQS